VWILQNLNITPSIEGPSLIETENGDDEACLARYRRSEQILQDQ